jgi:uncharacterized damage-inducible protein DinB
VALRDTVVPGFQLIWGTALKNVEAMPDSGLEFKPAGLETRSFREIALHMANVTVTFGENIGKEAWERIAAYPPDKIKGKAPVLASMRQAGERFLAGLPRLTDQEATRIVRTPWGFELPQGQLMMGHVPHMFYHNGQMTIYLRMQGIKPNFLSR